MSVDKVTNNIEDLNNTVNQLDLNDFFKILYFRKKQNINLFSSKHGMFIKRHHVLKQK